MEMYHTMMEYPYLHEHMHVRTPQALCVLWLLRVLGILINAAFYDVLGIVW
jgi:hypothetical protein